MKVVMLRILEYAVEKGYAPCKMLPKLKTWVRFPSSAPYKNDRNPDLSMVSGHFSN